MIDVAYENVIQFDMVDDTLDGRDLLESKVSTTVGEGKEFEKVVKIYFDLDNLEDKKVYIETEKYVAENLISNKKYLFFNPSRAGTFEGVTTNYIQYFLSTKDKKTTEKNYDNIQIAKFFILNLYKNIVAFQNILIDIISFYHYSIEDRNVILKFVYNDKEIDSVEFFNQFKKNYIFTIGYKKDNKKYLFCDNSSYINYLLDKKKSSLDESKLKIEGICDFCKETKKLINNFGAKPYPLKNLKNFTSTMPSIFYENKKNNLTKNIRCCIECFEKISQSDYNLDSFQIGILREECINCKNKQRYNVYAFIDVPFKQDIDYEDVKYAIQYLFGTNNALETMQKTVKNEEIFDEDWKIILNIFIVNRGAKKEKNETILNLRNINPHLFKKYNQIFNFINELNEELTYRTWKGNFSDIFSTISKADKRVSFEIFEAFLNEKELDVEKLIKKFLPLVKRKFIASIDDKKVYEKHYRYLLLDIANILIIGNLRKKEKILRFDIDNIIESYENKNKQKLYRKKETKEIVKILGFEWSDLEIGLFDLGMIIQESVSNVKQSKNTDIEKTFMRKMNFTGMREDEVMSYIGYIEQKFQDYQKFIYRLDNKRERLSSLGIALNQKEIDISPEKSAYLIAFGYELSTTISNKIGAIINKEKEENEQNG